MKKSVLIPQIWILPCLLLTWCALCLEATEQRSLILNGDFEAGKQYWRGFGQVIALENGNRVGQIIGKDRSLQYLRTQFRMDHLQVLEVRFRARYVGGGSGRIRLKIEAQDRGTTICSYDLPNDGSWKDFTMKYDKRPGMIYFNAIFQALQYEGVVQIDDVWAGEPKS